MDNRDEGTKTWEVCMRANSELAEASDLPRG